MVSDRGGGPWQVDIVEALNNYLGGMLSELP